jgi:hypothetical protein
MSEQTKEGIYVYQPDPPRKDGRMYALGGMPLGATCKGLTKDEAEIFAEALNDICWMRADCVACGHVSRFQNSHCSQCGTKAAPSWVE